MKYHNKGNNSDRDFEHYFPTDDPNSYVDSKSSRRNQRRKNKFAKKKSDNYPY